MKIDMIRYSWILLRYTHIHAYKKSEAWALSCKGDNADLTWCDVLHGVSNVSFSIDTYIKLHIMIYTKNIIRSWISYYYQSILQDGYNSIKKSNIHIIQDRYFTVLRSMVLVYWYCINFGLKLVWGKILACCKKKFNQDSHA